MTRSFAIGPSPVSVLSVPVDEDPETSVIPWFTSILREYIKDARNVGGITLRWWSDGDSLYIGDETQPKKARSR